MRIDRIKLDNIRSYENLDLKLTDSLLLIGDIGSGKSTILQAVEFALFGAQRGILDSNHLLRNGEDKGFVELEFRLNDPTERVIVVNRTLKRKRGVVAQDAGYLEIDGKREDLMPVELRSRILTLLGYPEITTKSNSMIYRYSVYATQEQMKQIILEKPESRMDTLRVIFGIDKYKQIIENSQFVMRQMRKKIAFFEGQIVDLTNKKGEVAELKSKKDEVTIRLESVVKKVVEIKEMFGRAEEAFLKKEVEMKSLVLLNQERKHISARLEEMRKMLFTEEVRQKNLDMEIQRLLDERSKIIIPTSDKSYDGIVQEVNELRMLIERNKQFKITLAEKLKMKKDILASLVREKEESQTRKVELVKLEAELQELGDLVKGSREMLDSNKNLDDDIANVRGKIQSSNTLIEQVKLEKEGILKLDVCPTCNQDVDSMHKQKISDDSNLKLNELSGVISNAQKELLTFENAKKILIEQEAVLQNNLRKQSVILERIKSLKNIEESLGEKLLMHDSIVKEIEIIEKKLVMVEEFDFFKEEERLGVLMKEEQVIKDVQLRIAQKENLQKIAEEKQKGVHDIMRRADEIKKTITDIEEKLVEYGKKLFGFEEMQQKVDRMKMIAEGFRKELKTAEIEREGIDKEVHFIDSQISKLIIEVEAKIEAQKKADWLKGIRSWIDSFFIPLMKLMEQKVLQQIYADFNHRFGEWFDMLIEDEAMSVSIDADFTPKISQNGYDVDVDSLSGGERTSVALAYRLTLNKIVNDLIGLQTKDLLILDEPTEGFSSEQLDRVRDMLDQLGIPQLLIVSHEQKMDGFVGSVLRVEKEGSVSRVVVV